MILSFHLSTSIILGTSTLSHDDLVNDGWNFDNLFLDNWHFNSSVNDLFDFFHQRNNNIVDSFDFFDLDDWDKFLNDLLNFNNLWNFVGYLDNLFNDLWNFNNPFDDILNDNDFLNDLLNWLRNVS
jgi:hypothetical protein